MKKRHNAILKKAVMAAVIGAFPITSMAGGSDYDALKDQVKVLQQQLEQVQKALKEMDAKSASKQDMETAKSEFREEISNAMTPNTLVHLAGYADVGYVNAKDEDGSFVIGSFSPILHYQFRDIFMLEAELEFEVEEDGETEVALEYMTIDWFMNDYSTLVGGKFLSPVGQFRQNLHPSWINKMADAPPGFGHDGAAPVSDVGLMVRGGFGEKIHSNYAVYIANGPELNAASEDGEFELEGIEAEGFGADVDGEKTFGGRFGIIPMVGLELGVSAATGKAAVTNIVDEEAGTSMGVLGDSRDYDVLGADFAWQRKTFELRGEYVQTKIGEDLTGPGASEGADWTTWYLQAAYMIPSVSLEPVLRYTDFDSPHASEDVKQWSAGLNYHFTNHLIAKFNYQSNDVTEDSHTPESKWIAQIAYGF
ncbi:MAG: hypothetical protein BMS9Abin25_0738 [Gammaproteobacteria bacterium]|nr:MAG: hypothetical protein BMS9Abin25_0738 [Gammaproteobacteria bacterium]